MTQLFMIWNHFELILLVEIIGTVAFAMSGALMGIQKKLDYYGITFFAIITAVGGGIIRDILIDRSLPASLANPTYIIISIVSAFVVILFYKKILHLGKVLQFFDAIGLGAFTAIGAQVAIQHGLDQPFVIVTLAVLTGTGGGVLRDVFAKEIPFVFMKEIYAVASILGAVLYVVINQKVGNEAALYACFAVTVLIRLISIKKNLQLKRVSDI